MEKFKEKIENKKIEEKDSYDDICFLKVISSILEINMSNAKNIRNVTGSNSLRELLYIKKYRDKLDIDTLNTIKRKQDVIKNFIELAYKTNDFGLNYLDLLNIFNVSPNFAKYHIFDNPFLFTDEIGYDKARSIADQLSLPINTIEHSSALIIHLLKKDTGNGHTYSDLTKLVDKLIEYKIDKIIIKKSLDSLLSKKISIKDNKIMLRTIFKVEEKTSNLIKNKLKINSNIYNKNELDVFIEEFKNRNRLELSEEQKEAIRVFSKSSIFILTGGPGTGKTLTAKAIVEYCTFKKLSICLSAPTGKASQRLGLLTNIKSSTIHSALGLTYVYKNAKNIIDDDVVLVDEVSMVGSFLFSELLKSISDKTKIVFIGDVDQIPSVEAGNILESLIDSKVIPTVRLGTVFRQAAGSKIITNAHKIKNSDTNLEYGNDFMLYKTENDQETMQKILEIYDDLTKNRKMSINDIAVLSPSKRTSIGTYEMNFQIQRRFNDTIDYQVSTDGVRFSIGDKVMQIKNNSSEGVYNGTIGIIRYMDDRIIGIEFENGTSLNYFIKDAFENLIHAYASTIHKYQGSEIKVVIIPLSMADKRMWNKKLFYTGLTRAKELFIMVGQEEVFKEHCMRDAIKRNTMLKELIQST